MTSLLPENETRTRRADLLNCMFILGLAFAALLSLLYLADEMGSFGFTMLFGIPLYVGAIIGHTGRYSTAWKIFAAVIVLGGVLASIIMWKIAGMLCTAIAGVILVVPLMVGASLGHNYQKWQQARRNSVPSSTTALLLFGVLVGLLYAESSLTPISRIESVETTRILDLPLDRAWKSLVFYEEVGLEPPLLTKIGLPYPLHTEGGIDRVGAVTRCVYSTGYLLKRITKLEKSRRLAFEVVEQRGVEDDSFELIGGRFEFESVGEERTRVVLTTTYRPLLQARFYWRPFEERLTHVLHDYVLDAMAIQDEGRMRMASR